MWQIDGPIATLQTRLLGARLQWRSPSAGLDRVRLGSRDLSLRWLAVEGVDVDDTAPLPDIYTRGRDLVVTYAATAERPLRTQMYWRVVEAADTEVTGIELIVSVQTHRLDADPAISVTTVAALRPADDTPRWHAGPLIDRWWYQQMVHPASGAATTCETVGAETQIAHRLFRERLEKGVIRRERIRGIFFASESTTAEQQFERFARTPHPLTA